MKMNLEEHRFLPSKLKLAITKEIYSRWGSLAAYYRKYQAKFPTYAIFHAVISGRMRHSEVEQQLKQDVLWHLIKWRTKKNHE